MLGCETWTPKKQEEKCMQAFVISHVITYHRFISIMLLLLLQRVDMMLLLL